MFWTIAKIWLKSLNLLKRSWNILESSAPFHTFQKSIQQGHLGEQFQNAEEHGSQFDHARRKLQNMTVPELVAFVRDNDIEGFCGSTKADLIEHIMTAIQQQLSAWFWMSLTTRITHHGTPLVTHFRWSEKDDLFKVLVCWKSRHELLQIPQSFWGLFAFFDFL